MTARPLVLGLLALGVLALFGSAPRAVPATADFEPRGFSFELEATVPVPPDEAFDAFTGDVSAWWDHAFSDEPARMFIEPTPGGGFYEMFDETNGVLHATVTFAQRGKRLVFKGPLGFHGAAFEMVHSFEFTAEGEDKTRIRATINGLGQVAESEVPVVRAVWNHFLIEQFVPYVERGEHRTKLGR